MKREDRKAAAAAYKERKADAGIFVVRCADAGQQWIGHAADLRTIWNRLSFALRQGSHPSASLQAAWRAHGPDALAFEVVERLDADALAYGADKTLKDRVSHWREALQAEGI